MTSTSLQGSDPRRLAELLDVSDTPTVQWRQGDFASVLRHQLAAPLATDLGPITPEAAPDESPGGTNVRHLSTFHDLLLAADPPLELLQRAKTFAKAHRTPTDGGLPPELAAYLYYACIAAALVRRRTRISQLTDEALLEGFAWCCSQVWGDVALAHLFEEAPRFVARAPRSDR